MIHEKFFINQAWFYLLAAAGLVLLSAEADAAFFIFQDRDVVFWDYLIVAVLTAITFNGIRAAPMQVNRIRVNKARPQQIGEALRSQLGYRDESLEASICFYYRAGAVLIVTLVVMSTLAAHGYASALGFWSMTLVLFIAAPVVGSHLDRRVQYALQSEKRPKTEWE